MNKQITDLYRLPNIANYEDVHLLALRETCAVLEERLEAVKGRMSEHDRQLLECYLDTRNDLEYETFKTALRLGGALGKEHF